MYAMGKKNATVYANGTLVTTFCVISQYDPVE
jgi:hypothetical protein